MWGARHDSARLAATVAAAGLAQPLLLSDALAQGPSEPFPVEIDLATLDGTMGFVLDGQPRENSGEIVGSAGDVNGDGIDDLLVVANSIGAPGEPFRFQAYIVFGRADGFPAAFDLATIDGTNGFILLAVDGGASGGGVSTVGDVNGDGIGDVGFGQTELNGVGGGHVVFGRDTTAGETFPRVLALTRLNGIEGFRFDGMSSSRHCGLTVAPAGDLNGDGIDDFVVTDENLFSPHHAFVVFGRDGASGGFPAGLPLESLDGSNGFRVVGSARNLLAYPAGDFNGDGLSDLLLGDPFASEPDPAYVIFGQDTIAGPGFPAEFDLRTLDGSNGFRLDGEAISQNFANAGASAGDVNGDGIDDMILGAWETSPPGGANQGRAYVVFGRDHAAGPPFPAALAVADLDGNDGFAITNDHATVGLLGFAVAGAGDLNGDGIDDVAVGDIDRDALVHVFFGRDTTTGASFPPALDVTELDGDIGFRLVSPFEFDGLGRTIAMTDVNGDGVEDLVMGARDTPDVERGGRTYVLYGRHLGCAPDIDGDGELTIFDFLAFQNAFDAMDPVADFDGDGEFTIFDFLAFQNEFDAGCE